MPSKNKKRKKKEGNLKIDLPFKEAIKKAFQKQQKEAGSK